jgi:hypothetical protein
MSKAPSPNKAKKRPKVSFSEEVIAKDNSGDGSKVVIKEEHGVFLGPLLGRMVVSADDESTANGSSTTSPAITFANDNHTSEEISYSESGILKRGSQGDSNVEYDNLVVRMGLLKCGHRYQVVIPIPDYWKEKDSSTTSKECPGQAAQEMNPQTYGMDVRVAEDSLDDDLRGEVQRTEYATNDSDESASCKTATFHQYHVCITLSARRRGPYRGRMVLELSRRGHDTTNAAQSATCSSGSALDQEAGDGNTSNNAEEPSTNKCLMSIQVDATIMGNDMGTPKLKNGVSCLGKMVGYDSDEETEWNGWI